MPQYKNPIAKNINEANYCSIDEDCIIVDFGCPFGCGSYVNRNADVDGMKAEIDLKQGIEKTFQERVSKNADWNKKYGTLITDFKSAYDKITPYQKVVD